MTQTLVRNIGLLASAVGQNERVIAQAAASANSLAVVAGNAAATANSRLDTISAVDVGFIRVTGTDKPVTATLTGLEASTYTVESQKGTLFTMGTGDDAGRVVVARDCLATIVGFGDGRAGTDTAGIADGNFRLLIRRRKAGGTGSGNILVDCRQFIRMKSHTAALSVPVTVELFAGDRISVETCCYNAERGNSNISLMLVEHPKPLALDAAAADRFAQITAQFTSIEARLTALENQA